MIRTLTLMAALTLVPVVGFSQQTLPEVPNAEAPPPEVVPDAPDAHAAEPRMTMARLGEIVLTIDPDARALGRVDIQDSQMRLFVIQAGYWIGGQHD